MDTFGGRGGGHGGHGGGRGRRGWWGGGGWAPGYVLFDDSYYDDGLDDVIDNIEEEDDSLAGMISG